MIMGRASFPIAFCFYHKAWDVVFDGELGWRWGCWGEECEILTEKEDIKYCELREIVRVLEKYDQL